MAAPDTFAGPATTDLVSTSAATECGDIDNLSSADDVDRSPETAIDYRIRRGKLSAYGRALRSTSRLKVLLCGVGVFLFAVTLLVLFGTSAANSGTATVMAALLMAVVIATGLYGIWRYTRTHFIEPDLAFRKWLQQVCDGDLEAQIDLPSQHQHHTELSFHTGNLAGSLLQLSNDMETLVENQTTRLNHQKQVLELLFALTADVAGETDEKAVFSTVCSYLANWFGGAVAAAYLADDQLLSLSTKGVSNTGLHDHVDKGLAMLIADVPATLDRRELVSEVTIDEPGPKRIWHRVRLPFFAGEQIAGMIVIRAADNSLSDRLETDRVLAAVSEQLSLFLGKQSAIDQTQLNRIAQDRNLLASEIHDSLAQTLLATGYQITLLRESMQQSQSDHWIGQVQKLQEMVSDANQEVRGLIQEYRSPLSEHRHAASIESTIEQFRESSGLDVFFQNEDPNIRFSPREHNMLQRIIVESLNNAKKYANASMIRVYLRCDPRGVRRLLIEDDGQGFDLAMMDERPDNIGVELGEHVGLAIMHERAVSIGANLVIESEPGEGTRVSLSLPPLIKQEPMSV